MSAIPKPPADFVLTLINSDFGRVADPESLVEAFSKSDLCKTLAKESVSIRTRLRVSSVLIVSRGFFSLVLVL